MASKIEPVGPSQNYQRFAWGTLALAGLVALFSTDRAEPAAAVSAASLAVSEAAPAPAKISQAPFNAAMPAAPAEAESDDEADPAAGDDGESQPVAAPSPETDIALADADTKGRVAVPASAAEAGQLMASSRNRSGGIDQGDEPVRAPAL